MCIFTSLVLIYFTGDFFESNIRDKILSASVKFLYPVSLKLVVAFSSAPGRLSCHH